MNVHELLALPADLMPDEELLVIDGGRHTYAQVTQEVDRVATALAALELEPGSVLGLIDVNSMAAVAVIFGAARLGLPVAVLNYRARQDELSHTFRTGAVRAVVTGQRYVELANLAAAQAGGAPITVVSTDDLGRRSSAIEAIDDRAWPEVDDEAVAALVFTGGTTALPKAVEITHAQLSGYVLATSELATEPSGVTLLAAPLHHIAGLTTLLGSVFGGRRIVMLPQFEAAAWLRAVEAEHVTHAFLVPTMLKRVLAEPSFDATKLGSLQVLSYGSAPMPKPVIREALERFPQSVGFVNAFGQTETTSTVTMLLPEDHRLRDEPDAEERRDRRLSSVGRPLPDVELVILDEAGRAVPPGAIGEVAVASSRTMLGYRTSDGRQQGERHGTLLRTRDLGYLDEEGYLYLVGRLGDMIIRGGENISPAEVEAVLLTHPAVEECAVIGIPDTEWGERVGAAVVLRDGASASVEELQNHCRERMASFKKPEEIRFLSELPRTSLGKVLRRNLGGLFDADATAAE